MGTQTLGNTAAGSGSKNIWWTSGTGAGLKARGNSLTHSGDIYVDAVYVYAWRNSSGTSTFRYALYSTSGTKLGETTSNPTVGTTAGFQHGSFAAASLLHIASGTAFYGAVIDPTSGGIETDAYADGGAMDYVQGTTTLANPWSGSGTKSSWGTLPWYITYFPAAAITGLPSTPQFPGATIDVFGVSFSAGVTSVKLNGVACSSVSVISDTHLTCVLPANATTGPVQVVTNAGTATSAGNLVVSGGRVFNGGTLKSTTAVRIYNGGTLKPITRIRVYNGGTLKDAH